MASAALAAAPSAVVVPAAAGNTQLSDIQNIRPCQWTSEAFPYASAQRATDGAGCFLDIEAMETTFQRLCQGLRRGL